MPLVLVPVADSVTDWSTNGVQGEKGWFYGYYNRSTDSTAGYQTSDFVPFPRSGNPYGSFNFWTGTQYRWPSTMAPWDTLGQTAVQPNGINSSAEHWVIRRWQSTVSGIMQAEWRLYKTDPNGLGVTGRLFHNGVQKDIAVLGGSDTTGVRRTVSLSDVRKGDLIDLVLTPLGIGGDTGDSGDGSANMLKSHVAGLDDQPRLHRGRSANAPYQCHRLLAHALCRGPPGGTQ